MRGGTSRGAYFRRADLPRDERQLERVLTAVMGGPDAIQVDGIGGGHPLNNKVAIVGPATQADADVDYLFVQVVPKEGRTSTSQNCGNILAGVGPFAIETGIVKPNGAETVVTVNMLNVGKLCRLTVQTPGGRVRYEGATKLDGVPGVAAPIVCDFLDIAGSSCGALLPTGNARDEIDGIAVTCIDNGMPVVLLRARDLGRTGVESLDRLNADTELKARLESIRLQAGPLMNLGDVAKQTVPKMTLVSAPVTGGHVHTRTFIPHVCHESIGVFGAVSVATGCILPGSVAEGIATVPQGDTIMMSVEHPSGALDVRLVLERAPGAAMPRVASAGLIRSARLLFKGEVCIPESVWKTP
jgi:4-oxalomesaconate tautomerase